MKPNILYHCFGLTSINLDTYFTTVVRTTTLGLNCLKLATMFIGSIWTCSSGTCTYNFKFISLNLDLNDITYFSYFLQVELCKLNLYRNTISVSILVQETSFDGKIYVVCCSADTYLIKLSVLVERARKNRTKIYESLVINKWMVFDLTFTFLPFYLQITKSCKKQKISIVFQMNGRLLFKNVNQIFLVCKNVIVISFNVGFSIEMTLNFYTQSSPLAWFLYFIFICHKLHE